MQQDWLTEGSLRNDIVITGEYTGDGLAWYEVVVDGPDTIRWRVSHGHVNSSGAWAETFLPLPTDDQLTRGMMQMVGGDDATRAGAGDVQSDEVPETVVLSHGLSIRYLRRGAHHILGDRWTFRVYGGHPMVTGAVTPHNEPQFSARGPFEGNSEITVLGNSFFPGAGLRCRLFDGDTNETMTLQGYYDSMRQVRCITQRIDPRPGGELVATIRPCVFKTLQVSHNGGTTWSAASANVQFLFCDIYVSTTGSDVAGYGTPDRPYATLQRGIEAALGKPRAYYSHAPKDFTSVRHDSSFPNHSHAHFPNPSHPYLTWFLRVSSRLPQRVTDACSPLASAEGSPWVLHVCADQVWRGPPPHSEQGIWVLHKSRPHHGGDWDVRRKRQLRAPSAGQDVGGQCQGVAVQVDPMKPTLKPPGSKRLKLEHEKQLSNFAFTFNLRRYTKVRLTVVIDCGQSGMGATTPTGDRHAAEDVTNTGSISFFGIQESNCNQQTYFPRPT